MSTFEWEREHGYENFQRLGVATFPVVKPEDLPTYRKLLDKDIEGFTEYKTGVKAHVLGGFSALGNPSSFHCPTVRRLRYQWYKEFLDLMHTGASDQNYELLFDRLLVRQKGKAASAESFHRDVCDSPDLTEDCSVYGGWVNLDDTPQSFSCILGTHSDVTHMWLKKNPGFVKRPKKDKRLCGNSSLVQVPPGHAIIFYQHILHEVVSKKAKQTMYRLFVGARRTLSNNRIYSNIPEVIRKQGVPLLPSGQKPPLYSMNHQSAFLMKPFKALPDYTVQGLSHWSSDTFKENLLVTKTVGSGLNKGMSYTVVPRYLKSLEELELPLYPRYGTEESLLYKPNKIEYIKNYLKKIFSVTE